MTRVAVLCHKGRGTAVMWSVCIQELHATGDVSAPTEVARCVGRMNRAGENSVMRTLTTLAQRGVVWYSRVKQSQVARWIPWLVTALAVAYIALMIPWRDSVTYELSTVQSSPLQSDRSSVEASPLGHDLNRCVHRQPGVLTLLGLVRWPWIAAYLGCMIAAGSLLVVRWHTLLKRSDTLEVSLVWCARAWAQAQVVSLLPIGQVGADAYRIERSTRHTSSLGRCSGIIVIERLVGLISMLLVGTTGIVFKSQSKMAYLLLIAAAAIAVGVVVAVPRIVHGLLQFDDLTDAPGWRAKICHCLQACSDIVGEPHTLARVLVQSILIQTLTPLSFAIVDRGLGFNTPVWCYLIAVPAVLLAQFLPIHVAGIGILEGGLGAMLGPWAGRSAAEVIALSSMVRILGMLWSGMLAMSFLVPVRRAACQNPKVGQGPPGAAEPASASSVVPTDLINSPDNPVAQPIPVTT